MPPPRERFLDTVRAFAVMRVMIWHAFGVAAITYFLSAVPAMFFVTGSLLAKSMTGHGYWPTLRDRLRRLLLPLWCFAVTAFAVMAVAHRLRPSTNTLVPWRDAWKWLFPLDDPKGSAWEAGWMSSPLWYLRALLWLLLASPLLWWIARRAAGALLAGLAFAVVLLDVAARHPSWPLQTTRLPWLVGDFCLYAFFVTLGFLHRDGRLAHLSRRVWAGAAVIAGGLAAAWLATQPVHDHVVNDSHPAHLLVGFAWLALFLAAAPAVERLSRVRGLRTVIDTINGRSMTIYLWHSSAIIIGYQLLWKLRHPLPPGLFNLSVIALMVAGTAAFVTLFGWIEDFAGRRIPQLWPAALARVAGARVATATIATTGMFVFVLVGGPAFTIARSEAKASPVSTAPSTTATHTSVRTPSQAPPTPAATGTITPVAVVTPTAVDATVDPAVAKVVATAQAWSTQNSVAGVQIGISKPGSIYWVGSVGTLGVDDTFDIYSVTKTMTATMIMRLVEAGVIDLDAPLPPLSAVPSFPSSEFTVRELLTHMTGLVNYRDTPRYKADPASITSPAVALADAASQPLLFTPGAASGYSSTNYLALGFLLEDLTGKPFAQLLHDEIFQPLGLDHTSSSPPAPGEPNFSTAGVVATSADLLAWSVYYLRDHAGLSDASWAMMSKLNPLTALGAGLIGYCPCPIDAHGDYDWLSVGYAGSSTIIQYSPTTDTVITINLSESLWKSDAFYAQILGLFESLRLAVA